jgi:hypothetical protein
MPLRARLDVATEHGRATRKERPHRPTHIISQPMRTRIGVITYLPNLLQRDLICTQGLSIIPQASIHHF